MNNDERELINKFFDRVGGNAPSQAGSGSVPMTNQMPPVDPDADRLIKENLQKYPDAGYRMTQMAVVQEAALVEAQNRIRQLEWQVQQASQQMQQQVQTQQQAPRGFLGGLFGGNRQQAQAAPQNQAPPPGWGAPNQQQQFQGQQRGASGQFGARSGQQGAAPPQNYPPGYQQGMFNRGGGGFLGSALTTAAGVAGGMFAYNALSGLFGGSHGAGGAAGGAVDPAAGAADPFAGGADPFSGTGTGADSGFDAGAGTDAGWGTDTGADNSGWGDDTAADDSGWGDGGSDDGNWGDDSF